MEDETLQMIKENNMMLHQIFKMITKEFSIQTKTKVAATSLGMNLAANLLGDKFFFSEE